MLKCFSSKRSEFKKDMNGIQLFTCSIQYIDMDDCEGEKCNNTTPSIVQEHGFHVHSC